ncbi:hypothetical protein DSO57_1006666 [Entomophthora muscae]|uniref:Uncharacterized protein n=1 Tax=Entomophthora muscae TaxID=34485 RepID=A0ACC2SWI3_9FUNG|nr:hypothetical protein DSO57_1006666 [Entomophthora muscae]
MKSQLVALIAHVCSFGVLGLARVLVNNKVEPGTELFAFVDIQTQGRVELQDLAVEKGRWANTDLDFQFSRDLLPPGVLSLDKKTCTKNSVDCLQVNDIYFYFHSSVQASDPVHCSASRPCFVHNDVDISHSWQVASPGKLTNKEWATILKRKLNIPLLKNLMPPELTHPGKNGSVFLLWFKPISWVVEGIYQTRVLNETVKNPFRAQFPLISSNHLNGLYGTIDLCTNNLEHPEFLVLDRTSSNLLKIQSFYCQDNCLY